ncbi:MAG: hypothetical protein EOP50_02255 [Sphingobacteriales bacterium]|nr:MAG: hypothetical protein EOP50_02255 [Sphingobacteriales bacterium]
MNKVTLVFPSRAEMAEFIIACRIVSVTTDPVHPKITGTFHKDCLAIAREQHGAWIDASPDFIEPGQTVS